MIPKPVTGESDAVQHAVNYACELALENIVRYVIANYSYGGTDAVVIPEDVYRAASFLEEWAIR